MAFVSGHVAALKSTSARSAVSRRSTYTPAKMTLEKEDGTTIVTIKDIEMEEQRKGFTFHSEKWNGRMAMLGFVIALGTEVISPAHPTIVQQLGSLIGQ